MAAADRHGSSGRQWYGWPAAVLAGFVLAACTPSWSESHVQPPVAEQPYIAMPTDPARIAVSEAGSERRYQSLGEITVTLHKTTILQPDPTEAELAALMRAKAATIGADAIIETRFQRIREGLDGSVLEGRGQAIKFLD